MNTSDLPTNLQLLVESHESEPLNGVVKIDIYGLGVKRTVELGSFSFGPKETKAILWNISDSPVAPVGTIARAVPRVVFTRANSTVGIPARALYFAFSEDFSRAFVSTTAGGKVRQASLGRSGDGTSTTDRAAALAAMATWRGRLDRRMLKDANPASPVHTLVAGPNGAVAPAAEASVEVRYESPSGPEVLVGDSISFPEEDALASPTSGSSHDLASSESSTFDIGATSPCLDPKNYRDAPICGTWKTSGFNDDQVAGTPPYEDYILSSRPASYALATLYQGTTVKWQGRLDASGCTPVQNFCIYSSLRLDVRATQMQRPSRSIILPSGVVTLPGTREINISPATTFSAPVLLASNPQTGQLLAFSNLSADTSQSEYVVRLASAVSRILTMDDSGVLPPTGSGFVPSAGPLQIHTENGCYGGILQGGEVFCPHGLHYYDSNGVKRCGEACANGTDAWFGPTLRMVNGVYVPTGGHTTDSQFAIAHELGHTVQYSNAAVPENTGYKTDGYGSTSSAPPVADYNDRGTGKCGCGHVSDGNQVHCLQSSHFQPYANVEGFAHFFATRVMNNQAASARFTYYKNFRQVVSATEENNILPPAPINAGAPFQIPGNPTTGWVRNFCSGANRSSEYDWLTFLWAVNGSASSSQRSSMEDVLAIVAASKSAFIWPNILEAGRARFGSNPSDPKFVRFQTSGITHGLNL